MNDSPAVFSRIQGRRGKFFLQIRLKSVPVLFEHEQIGRNTIVMPKRRMRHSILFDVAKLNFGNRQRLMRFPEHGKCFLGQEQFDMVGQSPDQRVK